VEQKIKTGGRESGAAERLRTMRARWKTGVWFEEKLVETLEAEFGRLRRRAVPVY
jgi:hypothetical protein